MKKNGIRYFLGANTPFGFVGFFDWLNDAEGENFCYIIKGGPGTGKSTFMKNISENVLSRGESVEFVHCSSDPDSLDGIVLKDRHICFADGTSPHVIEPAYPGSVESIINLGDALNDAVLRSRRKEIISLTKENSQAHSRCIRFLKGAEVMAADSRIIHKKCVDEEKLNAYADRLAKRIFRKKSDASKGRERQLFLSAVTPKGTVFFGETVGALARETILIEDNVGQVSGMLTQRLKKRALEAGYDVVSAVCPLNPYGAPEHLIIPECSLAFVRKHCGCQPEGVRTIHAKRFVDSDYIKQNRQRLAFNRKVRDEFILQAVASLRSAKEIHDKLENCYIAEMDFEKVESIQKEILCRI